ncbi:MAG: HDOD domain-containing protein [Actinobacteria bacterium]|nr:HDOD domain-containing protein [Actinomycetota bacterium]
MSSQLERADVDVELYLGCSLIAAETTAYTTKLMELLDDSDAEHDDIIELVSADAILVSKILTLANSAFVGARRESSNVWDAVRVLGLSMVRNVATLRLFAMKPDNAELPAGYFEHSVASAAGAAVIASQVGNKVRDAWAIALMHDLGIVLMASAEPDRFQAAQNDSGFSSLAEEHAVFGFGHDDVAAEVLDHLGLPTTLTSAIREHNADPSTGASAMSLTVRAGIALAEQAGATSCSEPVGNLNELLDALDLSVSHDALFAELDEHRSAVAALL